MQGLNMNSLIQYGTINTPVMVPIPHTIRVDMPNLSVDGNGTLYINIINRRGNNWAYRFSDNLIYVQIKCFTSDIADDNGKKSSRKSDDIVKFTLGSNTYFVKRKCIKGEYLIDHLTAIGVVFHLDAPKTKRSEALNQMVNRTIQIDGTTIITDPDIWDKMELSCEV